MTVWFRLDSETLLKIKSLSIAHFLSKDFGKLRLPCLRGPKEQVIDRLVHRSRGYHEVDTNG